MNDLYMAVRLLSSGWPNSWRPQTSQQAGRRQSRPVAHGRQVQMNRGARLHNGVIGFPETRMVIYQFGADSVRSAIRSIRLGRQVALFFAICSLAVVILAIGGRPVAALFVGWTIAAQLKMGAGLSLLAEVNSWFAYRIAVARGGVHSTSLVDSYSRFDLSGWNPMWFALCAGVGEELLFRGAIQAVVGLLPTSALFALAHARAYRFNVLNRRVVLQLAGLMLAGVLFGLLARTVGLIAAMMLHVAIDVGGLLTVRALQRRWQAKTAQ